MKILFTCNTFFQLITATRIATTIKKDDECSIVISHHSRNAEAIAKNVEKISIFKNVFYVDATSLEYNKDTSKIDFLKLDLYEIFGKDLKVGKFYDEFITLNEGPMEHMIFAYLIKNNPKMEYNLYEESILSYTYEHNNYSDPRYKKLYAVRKIFNKKIITDSSKKFYCFMPKAYKGKLKAIQIPKISSEDNAFKETIKKIFFPDKELNPYPQKYIYFGTGIKLDTGVDIGEMDMLKDIANKVGHDNIILKIHPRDDVELYKKEGFTLDQNSSIPWEAIQLNGDFKDRVLLSSTSTAIISLNNVLDNPPRSIFTYKLCDVSKTELSQRLANDVYGFVNNPELGYKNVSIIDSIEEI